jgi:hypothetical protein
MSMFRRISTTVLVVAAPVAFVILETAGYGHP